MKRLLKLVLTVGFLFNGINIYSQTGWVYQNHSLVQNRFGAICPLNKDTVFVVADSGKVLKTVNGGAAWTTYNTGYKKYFFDIAFCSADTGYAVGAGGTIIKTCDGGSNWSLLTTGANKDIFSVSVVGPNSVWAVGDSGLIINSTDKGATWAKLSPFTGKTFHSVRFRNASIGYIAGEDGALYKTSDTGNSWYAVPLSSTFDLFSICITPGYTYLLEGHAMNYGYAGLGAYRSDNDTNWSPVTFAQPFFGMAKMFFPNDSLGFTISSGCTTNGQCQIAISKTQTRGQSWTYSLLSQPPGPALPGTGYSDIRFVSDSIGYALSGNHILKTVDGGVFVAVHELTDNGDMQIFPNPFSRETTLRLDAHYENASVALYSAYGQLVRKEEVFSGSEIVLRREDLAAGIYYVTIQAGGLIRKAEKLVIVEP